MDKTNAIQDENAERVNILTRDNKKFAIGEYLKDVLNQLQFVGFYLVIGVLLGALVEVFMPGYWIAGLFEPGSWQSVMFAVLMGVPLYTCGGGVIPLIRSFMQEGMSRGMALAFLLAGPATRTTPIVALASVLRITFMAAYLVLVLIYSMVAGLLFK